jgi:hypothetical protein
MVFQHDDLLSIITVQLLATGRWFSPGTQVSSTNKIDRHDITEILLKVALNTINLNQTYRLTNDEFNLGWGGYLFMPPRRRVWGHINLPLLSIRPSIRILIHGLSGYLLYKILKLQLQYCSVGGDSRTNHVSISGWMNKITKSNYLSFWEYLKEKHIDMKGTKKLNESSHWSLQQVVLVKFEEKRLIFHVHV